MGDGRVFPSGSAYVCGDKEQGSARRPRGAAKSGRGICSDPDKVEVYHLERVAAILDQPAMISIRKQFLDIDYSSGARGGRGGDAVATSSAKATGGAGGDAGTEG